MICASGILNRHEIRTVIQGTDVTGVIPDICNVQDPPFQRIYF